MTELLLDTTFLIDAERADSDLDASIEDEDDVAVAAITIAELHLGVEMATGRRRQRRARFVDQLVATIPVLEYGIPTAREHAALLASVRRAGRPRGAHDLIIAATARASGRTVLTADPGGFEGLPGVEVRRHR